MNRNRLITRVALSPFLPSLFRSSRPAPPSSVCELWRDAKINIPKCKSAHMEIIAARNSVHQPRLNCLHKMCRTRSSFVCFRFVSFRPSSNPIRLNKGIMRDKKIYSAHSYCLIYRQHSSISRLLCAFGDILEEFRRARYRSR